MAIQPKTAESYAPAIAELKKKKLASIPKAWVIPEESLPSTSRTNVVEFTKECGILDQAELDLIATNATSLLNSLASKTVSVTKVITAFCKAAAIAHQLTNCLTEIYFTEALERAAALDACSTPQGALFGCPISLKDQFQLEGKECNMGIVGWIGDISDKNSVLVDILLGAGAIITCRTNVSQALMFGESDNYVHGRTTNPFNRDLTCGGSSGGEGALIRMGGSLIGVGTDLGGSVRIPAAYQGLFGLRPTIDRMPYRGARNSLLGMETITSALGPLSRTLGGVTAFSEAVVDGKPWLLDPRVPEIPWKPEAVALGGIVDKSGKPRKPVFGVMSWDGATMPLPPMKRALNIAVDALKKEGYELVDFSPPDAIWGESIVVRTYTADGGADLSATFGLSGEPHHPSLITGSSSTHLSTYESWQLSREKLDYCQQYLDAWNATASKTITGLPIDGLLLPPSIAPPHKHMQWHRAIFYTSCFNLVDYPAMVIPVNAFVDPRVDIPATDYAGANERDCAIQAAYKPEDYKDAPLSIQLVGRRFREEEVIGLTKVVVQAMKLDFLL
ncbi:amidase, partial [Tremellales sp. Uapishka_1]